MIRVVRLNGKGGFYSHYSRVPMEKYFYVFDEVGVYRFIAIHGDR